MTQVNTTDIPAAPASGLEVLPVINNMLKALRDDNAGSTAPSPTVPHMTWVDTSTSPPTIYRRNAANSEFVPELVALRAAPLPIAGAGIGQWTALISSPGGALVLPAGGTWAYYAPRYSNGVVADVVIGVAAGGTTIGPAVAGQNYYGLGYRRG